MWDNALLLLVIGICVITDLKSRKIYNKVIFPSLVLAFSLHLIFEGWWGLAQSVLGFTVGLGILLIPYLLGGMGAGDVKLLALIGALKGTAFVLVASVYMAVVGGVMALIIILFTAGLRRRFQMVAYALTSIRHGMSFTFRGQTSSAAYPYGVAIASGSALCLFLKGWGA